jgi:hypothetical protein
MNVYETYLQFQQYRTLRTQSVSTARNVLLCLPLYSWPFTAHEEFCLLRYNAVWSSESQSTFRRIIWPPSTELKSKPSKKQAWNRQQKQMKAICSSKLSVFTGLHGVISEETTFHRHRCKNLKFYIYWANFQQGARGSVVG